MNEQPIWSQYSYKLDRFVLGRGSAKGLREGMPLQCHPRVHDAMRGVAAGSPRTARQLRLNPLVWDLMCKPGDRACDGSKRTKTRRGTKGQGGEEGKETTGWTC